MVMLMNILVKLHIICLIVFFKHLTVLTFFISSSKLLRAVISYLPNYSFTINDKVVNWEINFVLNQVKTVSKKLYSFQYDK